ncbi:MAG: cysteine hydrolase [Desulfovibrionales bacterium]|nr:cysteine hydrolase [Desulfovibrionales bacterium]
MFNDFSKYTQPHPERSALLTIDLQNDFVLPGAPAEGAGALSAAKKAGKMAALYRSLGLPVIHVVRVYTKDDDAESVDACRREAIQDGLTLVMSGTEGMQLAKGLVPEGTWLDGELLRTGEIQQISARECVLYKPRWSAFDRTPLLSVLDGYDVDTVAVCGTWFANCIRTSLYEATANEIRAVALEDAIAGMNNIGKEDLVKIQCGVCSCEEWKHTLLSAFNVHS